MVAVYYCEILVKFYQITCLAYSLVMNVGKHVVLSFLFWNTFVGYVHMFKVSSRVGFVGILACPPDYKVSQPRR
jgi:hypothetical protein